MDIDLGYNPRLCYGTYIANLWDNNGVSQWDETGIVMGVL